MMEFPSSRSIGGCITIMNARYASVLLLVPLLVLTAQAQSIAPAVVGGTGGFAETATVSLSWSVGQTAVETHVSTAGTLTEGFQQSYLALIPTRGHGVPFSLNLYPNPARNTVMISLDGVEENMTLILYNLLGEVVLRKQVRRGERLARLTVERFPSGIYMLAAISGSGDRLALYKIVKAQ